MARIAFAVLLTLAGCQTPRAVRVEARFQSLAPPISGALLVAWEK